MRFSCAGKVFVLGEYACIGGGPAILITIGPRFELLATFDGSGSPWEAHFDPKSPAGLYLAEKAAALRGARITWRDPHESTIGVGSSSAQFLLAVALVARLEDRPLPGPADVLSAYWETVGTSQGLRPSGADVTAQWLGGPILLRNEPFQARKLGEWGGNARFVLAYTGSKARTHEHLASLRSRGFPREFEGAMSRLDRVTEDAQRSWEFNDADGLGGCMNEFQRVVSEAGFGQREFAEKIEAASRWDGVLGCKGSGAQGGDCALLLVRPESLAKVSGQVRAAGWTPILPEFDSSGILVS